MESRKDRHNRVKKPPAAAQGPKGQKPRFWKTKKFKWIMISLLAVVVIIVGIYAYAIGHFMTSIQKPKDSHQTPVQAEQWTGTEPVNIVLMGVDNRNNDPNPRADSILVISVDPKTKKAKVMSVMRDTWYNIPGHDFEKINAANAIGGPDLQMKTLRDFLQIPLHYYVKTDFKGFMKIVDALGGVDIDVEKDLNYADDGIYDIHLKKGYQHLDGNHALQYVRFRYDELGDYNRTMRQRKFLQAVADQMISTSGLVKLPSVLSAVEPYIETNMDASDMLKLGQLMLKVDKSDIQQMQVPPRETSRDGWAGGGQAVILPDVYETQKKVFEFLGLDESKLKKNETSQPKEYYDPTPVVPNNPNVKPDTPDPTPPPTETTKPETGPTTPETGTGTGTGGKTPGTGTGGTTPGTGTVGTTPGTGTGGTTPGTGTGGSTPGTGTGTGGTTPGTGTGGTTPGTGTGGTTPGTGTGGKTPGTGGTTPGTGGTTPGTGTGGGTGGTTPGTGGGGETPAPTTGTP
ncbi:LCP family protein [Tumebacillus flagellatus]|uniref:Cell envelope-related transcriptional attenuator domain-containing protein n=1 Tax=Tumebacillus flagellatus TaxID=1157490 RepID=A0A074LMC8_9BACL|nr:LCP family protein [Tumebacillus flagellatus]KEO82274.1 hypothetical protein EL26_15940 [Tumebacillus flagellatus]